MKYFLFCIGLFLYQEAGAQTTSESFTVTGEVLKAETIDMAKLSGYTQVHLDSLRIYTHDMQPKGLMKNIQGVLLKDILSAIPFNNENPKVLSEYYIECGATDNYIVLFSWNEIFNSETGKHVMIITGKNGTNAGQLDDRIALVSPTDQATGRRYVKWLNRIIIRRQKT
ncbi:MAG TPA: molybdopterin-binding protein [Puia sp.]|nr:molybdopterin-binding protein [Puia sp.]